MHIHVQRFQRPDGDHITFGVKCVLETTPQERALMEKYHAVDVAHIGVENTMIINGMMAGGLQEWHDDVRHTQIVERGWFAAADALAAYLEDVTAFHTEDTDGDDIAIGYISEEFGFMRGGTV